MANRIRYKQFDQLSFLDVQVFSKLPRHHFWSNIESKIDFSFADRLCSVLYTGRGQHPYAPSLKLKVHLIQTYHNESDRLTEQRIIGDLFIKRFLGVPVDFFGFDHSTIGLDRGRMGPAMFKACHWYILAQMLLRGLWGENNEQWIIDSFPCHAHAVAPGAYRLIQHAVLRILNLLKRSFPDAFQSVESVLDLKQLTVRIPRDADPQKRILAFSKLTAEAYALLEWFESEQTNRQLCSDEKKQETRGRLYERRSVLEQILKEYTRELQSDGQAGNEEGSSGDAAVPNENAVPNEDTAAPVLTDDPAQVVAVAPAEDKATPEGGAPEGSAPESETEVVRYEKIPPSERTGNGIVSAAHPDVRIGRKTVSVKILGFKVQMLCTTCGVILNTRLIPASEHDRSAAVDMVKEVYNVMRRLPSVIAADTAYGHGKQRVQLEAMGIQVAAPVPVTQNPKGLYDISRFTYLKDKNVFVCPQGKETVRKLHNKNLNGTQYYFGKKNCQDCPLREACTTNKSGRSVFLSDYHDQYERGKAFNESSEGEEASRNRYVVERKNQECKNNCGMGSPRATRQSTLSIKSSLSAMVVNLKLVVRELIAPKPGFLRRTRPQPNLA